MPSAAINATCGSASGTATTATDGTYMVKITGGSLPCVLTATSSDGKRERIAGCTRISACIFLRWRKHWFPQY
jgi:hypothetical protein